MKKIAVDLDGVVFDSENLYRVYTEIFDVDIKKADNVVDNSRRIFQQRYDWSREEFEDFYRLNSREILTESTFMPGAVLVLGKLKERFETVVLTSRSGSEAEIAKARMEKAGLGDIAFFCDQKDKTAMLLDLKADFIIDDDEQTCLDAAENGITALFFKNNAAHRIDGKPKLVTVNNWGEIYKFLTLGTCGGKLNG